MRIIATSSAANRIRACQDTVLVVLRPGDFPRLLANNLVLYKHFALLLCPLVRIAFISLEDETLLSLQARFAKRLVALADTYGTPHEAGVMINLHLPQQGPFKPEHYRY